MLNDDIVADLLGDSPQIRPDSPQIRQEQHGESTGKSPDSPLSPPMHQKIASPDDGPRATIWRVWVETDGKLFEVDAIRGRPYSAAEVLAEFPDAVDLEPRNASRPKP